MRALKVLACCVVVGGMSMTVLGQEKGPGGDRPARLERPARPDGGPGPREPLSAEQSKAAWELQATGVAKRLSLKDEQVKAVVKAYSDARTSHQTASDKLRDELISKLSEGNKDEKKDNKDAKPDGEKRPGGRGAGFGAADMKAMEDMNKAEREKLEKALASTLSTEQTAKAVASLGTFNRQWDNLTNAIVGFKLEAAKQQTALDALENFVVAQGKTRAIAAEGDREATRTAMQEARQKLSESLKTVLSEDQAKTFEESMRGGGMRGPGGPGGPGRDGPGRDK
ncbi:MAG: hypothetical protein H7210_14245 [Pyrinomonadaceae bacterium]|nr:hypothetical protein [Phycisphaerales bacterium]